MYCFKLSNGEFIDHLEIDGYIVGDLAMDNIMISIKIDENDKIIAEINDEDKDSLIDIDYEPYLREAEKISSQLINKHDFDSFNNFNYHNVIDIVDKNNSSYYKKFIPKMNSNIYIKLPVLHSIDIMKKIDKKI